MSVDEIFSVVQECADCICTDKCPYYEDRNDLIYCMTHLMRHIADAMEELRADNSMLESANRTFQEMLNATGQWIEYDDGLQEYYECSLCHEPFCFIDYGPEENEYKYCPNCGARLIGVQHREEEDEDEYL